MCRHIGYIGNKEFINKVILEKLRCGQAQLQEETFIKVANENDRG